MKPAKIPDALRLLSIQKVILVVTLEGKGVEGNLYREVYSYFNMDGDLICVKDPYEGSFQKPESTKGP